MLHVIEKRTKEQCHGTILFKEPKKNRGVPLETKKNLEENQVK